MTSSDECGLFTDGVCVLRWIHKINASYCHKQHWAVQSGLLACLLARSLARPMEQSPCSLACLLACSMEQSPCLLARLLACLLARSMDQSPRLLARSLHGAESLLACSLAPWSRVLARLLACSLHGKDSCLLACLLACSLHAAQSFLRSYLVLQPIKKFPAFYGTTRKFITVLTSARHLPGYEIQIRTSTTKPTCLVTRKRFRSFGNFPNRINVLE